MLQENLSWASAVLLVTAVMKMFLNKYGEQNYILSFYYDEKIAPS